MFEYETFCNLIHRFNCASLPPRFFGIASSGSNE